MLRYFLHKIELLYLQLLTLEDLDLLDTEEANDCISDLEFYCEIMIEIANSEYLELPEKFDEIIEYLDILKHIQNEYN